MQYKILSTTRYITTKNHVFPLFFGKFLFDLFKWRVSLYDELICTRKSWNGCHLFSIVLSTPFAITHFWKIENIDKNQNISAEIFAETEKATPESLPRKSKKAYENLHTLLIGKKKTSVTSVITEELLSA
jgi:hypothetical protein